MFQAKTQGYKVNRINTWIIETLDILRHKDVFSVQETLVADTTSHRICVISAFLDYHVSKVGSV